MLNYIKMNATLNGYMIFIKYGSARDFQPLVWTFQEGEGNTCREECIESALDTNHHFNFYQDEKEGKAKCEPVTITVKLKQ